MNGRTAKILRGRFGAKTASYRNAKRQLDAMPTSFAQRTKPAKERALKHRFPSEPTWPRTEDQRHQSRPMIELRRSWPGQNHTTGRISA